MLDATDLPRLLSKNDALLQVARDPFGPLLAEYATFQRVVSPDSVKYLAKPGCFKLYERSIRFASFSELPVKLDAAVKA